MLKDKTRVSNKKLQGHIRSFLRSGRFQKVDIASAIWNGGPEAGTSKERNNALQKLNQRLNGQLDWYRWEVDVLEGLAGEAGYSTKPRIVVSKKSPKRGPVIKMGKK